LFSSNYLPTRLLVTKHNIAHLVNSLKKNGRKRCIVFCEDIEHAEATAKLLKETGQSSVFVVHSGMTAKVQEFAYQQFEHAQDASWLVNVGLVSVGVDIPCTDAIAIMRDVGSLALLIQMIGRGLRPFGVKVSCLVYDFGNGTSRFGFIDAPRLLGAKEGGQKAVEGKHVFKTCPKCDALFHPAVKTCKNCGHVFDQIVKINAEAKSIQLLSGSARNAPSHFTDHLFVSYGGATQAQNSNGTWLISHKLFDQSRELFALEAISSSKADPNKYELGHQVLVRRGAGSKVEFLPEKRANRSSRTSSRGKMNSVQSTRMAV
jgi:superfamily II DNA helicase RecQ